MLCGRDVQLENPDEAPEGKTNAMHFQDIHILALSFRNICKVENLNGLKSLRKLKLDNNFIERIENLEHLRTLEWLDLSFNRITTIEGLSTLTQLSDLSLFSNQIEHIGTGLDNLTKLNVLSLGDNKISTLDEVKTLRKFKHLRLVNLAGNPISQKSDYRKFVIAHLNNLKYLDHRLISDADVDAARIDFQESRQHLEKQEDEQLEKEREHEEKEARRKKLNEANMDGVEELHDRMLAEDSEHEKLIYVPNLTDRLSDFKEKFDQRTDELRTSVLQQHQKKIDEKDEWSKVVRITEEERDEKARKMIAQFRRTLKRKARKVHNSEERGDDARAELSRKNDALKDALIDIEIDAVDVVSQQVRDFDINYTDLSDGHKTLLSNYFTQLRELENEYYESLTQKGHELLERYNNGQLEDELSQLDDTSRNTAETLLADKDSLFEAIQSSHDARTAILDDLEDTLLQREGSRLNETAAEAQRWAERRNRSRISEIHSLHQRLKQEIEAVGSPSAPVDDETALYHSEDDLDDDDEDGVALDTIHNQTEAKGSPSSERMNETDFSDAAEGEA